MKRRYLITLMALPLLLSACSGGTNGNGGGSPSGSSSQDEQGLVFYLLDDGTYGVGVGTAYYLTNIVVPSTFNGKEVTKVVGFGFGSRFTDDTPPYKFKNVTLPNTIKTIDEHAFANSSLETITLPKSVTHISQDAFSCTQIKTITYEGTFDQFKNIEFERAFYGCGYSYSNNYDYYKYLGDNFEFKFSDKTVHMFDLFDEVDVQCRYADEYVKENEEIVSSKTDTNGVELFVALRSSVFNQMNLDIDSFEVELSNPDILILGTSTRSFTLTPKETGSTNITVKVGSKTLNFTYKIATPIEATVHEALEVINGLPNGQKTKDIYSIVALVKEIDDWTFTIADSLDSEEMIYVINVYIPGHRAGQQIKAVGRLGYQTLFTTELPTIISPQISW